MSTRSSLGTSKHRFLGNKASTVRVASAACVQAPEDASVRAYLKGLCDALHGSDDPETTRAIHVARQVIISTQER